MKKLAIGCGIVLAIIAAIVVGLVIAAPKIFKKGESMFNGMMKDAQEKAQFEAAWTPPTPELSEKWFPEEFAGWKRTSVSPFDNLVELDLKRDGYSAEYAKDGRQILLKIVPASDLEMDALLGRAAGLRPLPANSGGMTTTLSLGNVHEKKFGERERYLYRSLGKWFFLAHTIDGAETRPFVDAYLHAIDTQPAATDIAPAPAATPEKPDK